MMQTFEEGIEGLRVRLPPGWRVERAERESQPNHVDVDTFVNLVAPDGRLACIGVEVKEHLEPKGAIELWARLLRGVSSGRVLVMAPYLSAQTRDKLTELGFDYMDLTGNTRLVVNEPGLFVQTGGATTNPFPEPRRSRSLRGSKAGRIVRALIDAKISPKVRELAQQTEVDPGYVSRVLGVLDHQALISRGDGGRIVSVDWERLLRYWAQESPLETRGVQVSCLALRGLITLQERLKETRLGYAITGGILASRVAPIAPPRLAMLYVERSVDAIKEWDLRPAQAGANVLLIEGADLGVWIGSNKQEDGLCFVAVSQAAADLLTSPGRGPSEANELIQWMLQNEEVWRG